MTAENIKTVGIAGAGTMGQGIAQVCALSGFNVLLFDAKTEIVSKGIATIEGLFQKNVEKNRLSAEAKSKALSRINVCESVEQLKADLIIEAVVEKAEVKKDFFRAIQKNNPNAILTSNTSSIPITQIAAAVDNPALFAGLHFFNPATAMKLIEVIQGIETSAETTDVLKGFALSLGKTPVVVKDSPGFIVNRVARHYYVEALKMLEEKSADVQTIDQLLKASGFKMGSFELMDLIGLDVNFSVTASMFNAFHQDPKFRPSKIQQQKVDAGHWGVKSGKGFYNY
jgi:3-hydroxybutyryl-CoA dehydrogenase